MLEDVPLDHAFHERGDFDCGVPVLNEYLQRYAAQPRRQGVASVYVIVDTAAPAVILGYYTLGAAQIDTSGISEVARKRLPRFPVPCFRMGRLACRADQQGRGLGRLLMGCALDRCLKAREQVAAYALVVDAKDDKAKAFYEHHGFSAFVGRPLSLYLPLGR